MKLESGKPTLPGLYIVFVPGHGRCLVPHLVVWKDGTWRFRNASEAYPDEVVRWSGPLPEIDRASLGYDL